MKNRPMKKLKIPVLPTVDDAIAWTNDLIAKIDAVSSRRQESPVVPGRGG